MIEIASLRDLADCHVLTPDLYGYDQARQIFNRMIDNRPRAIVSCLTQDAARQCASVMEIADEPYAVRGGGHSIAGLCMPDNGIVLDFSSLRRVTVDAKSRVAIVEPGALMCDLDAACWAHGLGVTGGIISNTGVAGLVLGGGLGWLMGAIGLSCDNLVGVEAVDGGGNVQQVTADSEDLWAFRGAGRELGTVTEFRFALFPLPDHVVVARWSGPSEASAEMAGLIGSHALNLPDEITVSPVWKWSGAQVVPVVDAVSLLDVNQTRQALRSCLGGMGRLSVQCHYPVAQRMLDSTSRFGRRNYWKSLALSGLTADIGQLALNCLQQAPSRSSFVSIDVLHGKALVEPPGGSAYRLRDRPFVFLLNTIWTGKSDDKSNMDWTRASYAELAAATPGENITYANYLSSDDLSPDVSDQRLNEVRNRWH